MVWTRQAVSICHVYLMLSSHVIPVCQGARPAASLDQADVDQKSQHDGVRVHRAHLLDDGTGSSLENSTDAWGKKSVPSPPEPPLRRSYCWSEDDFAQYDRRKAQVGNALTAMGVQKTMMDPPGCTLRRQDATVHRHVGVVTAPLDRGWIGFIQTWQSRIETAAQVVSLVIRETAQYIQVASQAAAPYLGPIGLVLTGVSIALQHKEIQDLKRELANLDPHLNFNEHQVIQCQIKHARLGRFTTIISFVQGVIATTAGVATGGASVAVSIALSIGSSMSNHIRSKHCADLKRRLEANSAHAETLWEGLEDVTNEPGSE
ncbi:unnamed protein product [Symbiodinium natans]|uniref:SMODS and SLOG-associating 2TM effector domain-containing protein n=1 Tax=Symbiodinium natans TaxID=878477 RepID=A0A812MR58_9DINO|nr:unnamed protein product [Symbiodinium natans]